MKLTDISAIKLGLWISPAGQILQVVTSHITDIINNPTKFGITKEYIEGVYAKYGEPLHMENNAREEVIRHVLQRGWIRVRNYSNYWSVTLESLSGKSKNIVRDWVYTFVKAKVMGRFEEIRLLQISNDNLKSLEADDIIKFALEESAKQLDIVKWDAIADLEILNG